MSDAITIREDRIEANGVEFAYLEAGHGPLALLLHGFPDNAWTWSAQIPALAEAGYRVVAPFLRGYPPTSPAPDGRYDPEVLGLDVIALIEALGDEPAFVLGNDWGAVSTYAAMALRPEAFRRSVVTAAGHTATLIPTLGHPDQLHHIFHFWLFQQPEFAAGVVRLNDFALVDYLWQHWSGEGFEDREHIAEVKRTLTPEGAVEAALAYYPGLLHLGARAPETAEKMRGKVTVPTLAVFGAEDPPREMSAEEHVHFSADYRLEIVEGAGHFVHREQPGRLNALVLDWFAADPVSPRPRETAAN